MLSDIEIAQACSLKPIQAIADRAGIAEAYVEPHGKYKAKISLELLQQLQDRANGKLIYVTAITPTPAGEGKTTTAIGLAQAFGQIEQPVLLCLREPSLGPVFGVKGGATGGGYSQILPMDEINLHFTGDIHAVTAAHNLLAALLDNHLYQGNALGIDPKRVVWRRVMDISDRQLRSIVAGLGNKSDGVARETGFDITVASEIMAILCLTTGIHDLKERLGRILVAYTYDNQPVYARDLKATGAMAVLLKEAIKPNLVQTIEGQPALVHGGPFANIAHGNNSIIATRLGLKLSKYVITEGGFASDLGAEKFFDIVSRAAGVKPDTVVLVASVRALKFHGGVAKEDLSREDLAALERGFVNLERHYRNLHELYRLPVVVAINRFPSDTPAELEFLAQKCQAIGARSAISEVVAKGGPGGIELARAVLDSLEEAADFQPLYPLELPLKEKLALVATRVYGAEGVAYTSQAEQALKRLEQLGYGNLPVCIAKTQMSFSDDPALKGAPSGWTLTVREVRVLAGAGFVVAIAGTILTMPGLPKVPAAEQIDLDDDGRIRGLF
ncbi:formate-tetrahydrofolate ligase [Hydrogenispora ethanolica]|uniref:Formate--tetrahydrofolate ligase n=1 Tax=Hydrogenispora ethanolica TaxID=1082276 RepID=A0A4R1QZ74_HYDET|nr:formate--tetrahydrofolate ligase [Hydrogenispora ethanolica]TCL58280.1 formate-tetrahydrofolate ligase [Hydrogenispora ethanolica]